MIYRLFNIETGRYATEEEMKYLRVTAEGVVERWCKNIPDFDRHELLVLDDDTCDTVYMTLNGTLASCAECAEHDENPNTGIPYCDYYAKNKVCYYLECPKNNFEIDEDNRNFMFEATAKVRGFIEALFFELDKDIVWQPATEWAVETWTTITDDPESLPEESGEYLVLVKDNETIYPNVWSLEKDNKFRVSHWLKSIIAWQPIDKYEVRNG